jgi:capsular exopolysaccharide synthesis family protein
LQDQRLTTILWRGKWLILAAVVVSAALAVLITKRADKVYQAQATFNVSSSQSTGPVDLGSALSFSVGLAATYAKLLEDRGFLSEIKSKIGDGTLTAGELKRKLNAAEIPDTTLIRMTADGPSPESARTLASQVANAFLAYVDRNASARSEQQQQRLQEQINELNQRIERTQRGNGAQEELNALRSARRELTAQLAQLAAGGAREVGTVALAAAPTASSIAVSPRPLFNLVAGILLGLVIGTGAAFLRTRLDRGLHSADEAEELLSAPVLASIPIRRRFSSEDAVLGEAYDVLRANLAFLALDQPLQVLTFTSYNPGEGKSSTVEGLAYAAVRGGMSVLLIDGDVRTRALSTRLECADAPGLTSVVVGMSTIEAATIELSPGLSVLPAGPTPPNPPSLLSSARLREVVNQLRDHYNLIVIDSPPVAHLADASILAAASDGVIVVARVGVTARADLPSTVSNLRHSPTPLLGIVVLEQREIDNAYYPAVSRGRDPVTETADSF